MITADDTGINSRLKRAQDRLLAPSVIFFPVRHHSPACAWHIQTLIRSLKPSAVLIEGPASFTNLIPLILHPDSNAPFAIYTNYVDNKGLTESPHSGSGNNDSGPRRFAAYYPFCDYSPELAALRTASETGAELSFIDLEYPEQVRAAYSGSEGPAAVTPDSLMQERRFAHSRYLNELARRAGCRDSNELWDHLFESRFQSLATDDFIRMVACYCFMARENDQVDILTRAREAAMAWHIGEKLAALGPGAGPIVVVTGGYHSVALPELMDQHPSPPAGPSVSLEDTHQSLIRYSYEQLDALNGYAAGMPSPDYYDKVWRSTGTGDAAAYSNVAARTIVKIGRLTRKKKMQSPVSVADEIAALDHASMLAAMRGHPGPVREDVLDGIRSSFVKGSITAEGRVILNLAEHALSGNKVGHVPDHAGVPPIVADFRERAHSMRFKTHDSIRRKLSLDIYRKSSHRQASRFLHCLEFLGVPFAGMTAGPDFVAGTRLDLIIEHWKYAWTPQTESGLIDVAVYGATVREAALNRLRDALARLEEHGQGRNAGVAVSMLIDACRMGLQEHADTLLALISSNLDQDPDFASVVQAARQLVLLWRSREPLGAHDLGEIPRLIHSAFIRACFLAASLAACPEEQTAPAVEGLAIIREIVASAPQDTDPELLWSACEALVRDTASSSAIAGAAAGVLYADGKIAITELATMLAGRLGAAAADWSVKVGFLKGVMVTSRQAAWQSPELVQAVDECMMAWSEDEFVAALPEMRLAFANLTPRETEKVAGAVAGLYSLPDIGKLVHHDTTTARLEAHRRMTELVIEALRRDGLGLWVDG
jgi:hypothetical protein